MAEVSPGHSDLPAACRLLLEAPLNAKNYKEKFQLLLHLEEIQMEVNIRCYDMKDVPMDQDRGLLVLKVRRAIWGGVRKGAWSLRVPGITLAAWQVPGVAENRPSVLKGDYLIAHLSSERDHSPLVQYKGYVHGVELESVRLGFSTK